uniref:Retroviral polymerase SH3-like domain-containing protein n=1 Tax=Tanacetum cinerariifolium TaxID=118510 RepID=A0A6L2JYX1_TANCI|nr:hypothetical protein [Tanacetum cinerariifolium]
MTLIEATRTMLADSLLPISFWAEAVNTACYAQNRVLVTKPHNKTPYELLLGRTPSIGFMRPFRCLVTILNTLDPLGKFDGKADKGFLVGYSVSSKAFRVFNIRIRIVQETLHNTDVDAPFDVKKNEFEVYISLRNSDTPKKHDDKTKREAKGKSPIDLSTRVRNLSDEFEDFSSNNTKRVNAAKADFSNLETNITVSPIPTTRVHKDHHVTQIIGDLTLAPQTRSMARMVYGDDIIFVSTNKELCKAFEKLMKDKFQISSMGELTFFYGKSASTLIDTEKLLLKDPDGKDVDVHIYRSMIGSLMYLTSSRPDIMFVVCACAHFQVTLKVSHLHAVKRIFRYLKSKPYLGLRYTTDSLFNLVAYSDSDYARASLDRKSTTGGCQFLGFERIVDFLNAHTIQYTLMVNPPIYVSYIKQFWASVTVKKTNDIVKLQALIDRKKVIIIEDTIRQNLRLDDANGVDCLPNEEIFVELARMGYEKPSTKLTFYKAFFVA